MEAEGGTDNEVVLRSGSGRRLEVIEVFVDDWTYAGAVNGGKCGDALRAADETGDGGGAKGWGRRAEKVGKDGASNVAAGSGEKDPRRLIESHGGVCLDTGWEQEMSRQEERVKLGFSWDQVENGQNVVAGL